MFRLVPYNRNNSISKRDYLFNSFLSDFFNENVFNTNYYNNPIKADISENEHEYLIEAELAGVNKENINVEYKNDILTISVAENESKEDSKDGYIRKERYSGSFSRSFQVQNIDNDKISASHENGILKIKLPKLDQNSKNYKIEIN